VARALTEIEPHEWYAGGAVLADLDEAGLRDAADRYGAEVQLLTGGGADSGWAVVRTPNAEERTPVRYSSTPEARRRITLAALDLARRTVPR
jgi:hypothetical protein